MVGCYTLILPRRIQLFCFLFPFHLVHPPSASLYPRAWLRDSVPWKNANFPSESPTTPGHPRTKRLWYVHGPVLRRLFTLEYLIATMAACFLRRNRRRTMEMAIRRFINNTPWFNIGNGYVRSTRSDDITIYYVT